MAVDACLSALKAFLVASTRAQICIILLGARQGSCSKLAHVRATRVTALNWIAVTLLSLANLAPGALTWPSSITGNTTTEEIQSRQYYYAE